MRSRRGSAIAAEKRQQRYCHRTRIQRHADRLASGMCGRQFTLCHGGVAARRGTCRRQRARMADPARPWRTGARGGLEHSVATGGCGVPLGITAAGANRHDRCCCPTHCMPLSAGSAASCLTCAGRRRRQPAHPPASSSANWASPTRSPARARPPHSGRAALACGAKPLLDERLRQAPPDDRPQRQDH